MDHPYFVSGQGLLVGFHVDAKDCVLNIIYSARHQSVEPVPQVNNDLVGSSVWSFISGEQLRHLYKMMFTAVRHRGKEIVVPYRCDSPTMKRSMELKIMPCGDEQLFVLNFLIDEEVRERVALLDQVLLEQVEPTPDSLLIICSWCNKVKLDSNWVEVQVAVRELDLLSSERLPMLSHGVCEPCVAIVTGTVSGEGP